MELPNQLIRWMVAVLLLSGVTACDVTNTSERQEKDLLRLSFKTIHSTSSATTAAIPVTARSEHDSLIIQGSNGMLEIADIRFIVEKFKLEREDDDCEERKEEEGDGCEEFEADPFFVDLPLTEDTLNLADSRVDTGLYEELEFEVEDLDFDDEEEHRDLRDSIRTLFPEWPSEASMVILGSFTSEDGNTTSFQVFAEAEIEIEKEFDPPLQVTEDNRNRVVSIRINPVRWFSREDGTVLDLHSYDWDETGELLEFSAEFKDGVEEVEIDDDDDDDDDDEG